MNRDINKIYQKYIESTESKPKFKVGDLVRVYKSVTPNNRKYLNKIKTIIEVLQSNDTSINQNMYDLDKTWDYYIFEDELEFFNKDIKPEDREEALDLMSI